MRTSQLRALIGRKSSSNDHDDIEPNVSERRVALAVCAPPSKTYQWATMAIKSDERALVAFNVLGQLAHTVQSAFGWLT